MKYCQYWKGEVALLPSVLRDHVISYKSYKKIMKRCESVKEFVDLLWRDAQNTDAFFKSVAVGGKKNKSAICKCMGAPDIVCAATDVYKYAQLNSTTLYKICKKASKKMHDQCPMEWLIQMQNERRLAFVNGLLRKQVELVAKEKNEDDMQCPVCLEGGEDGATPTMLILNCGHLVCCECVKGILGVAKAKGTLYNLIAHGLHNINRGASCPLCRDPKAFIRYKVLA